MEIHRVRTRHKRAVVVVRIKHLHRQRLPTTRRTAVHKPRPALANPPELLFNRGQKLMLNRIAIRPHVGRVHRVAIVVKRIGMLNFDNKNPRESRRCPLLELVICLLLLNLVVPRKMKALRVLGLQIRIRRRRPKVFKAAHKVVMKDRQRIVHGGVFVEALRHQYHRRNKHRATPELRQQITLDAQMPHVLRIRLWRNRANHLVQRNRNRRGSRANLYLARR